MNNNLPTPQSPTPWKASDAWLGLALLIVLLLAFFVGVSLLQLEGMFSQMAVSSFELLLLAPIAVIFSWRKIAWRELGLRGFERREIFRGLGLLALVYIVVAVNNIVMTALGVVTQADVVFDILGESASPIPLVVATVVIAPIVEELFFRGFLFKGLRDQYGWKNALMFSSIIFSLFHMQVAALVPTFLLGALFAYIYQRTESVYPGMLLHFLVNSLGICGMLVLYQTGQL
ncbi:MAG TPA: CPBP family intramembrane metalloprotease [Anaerolineales bacterium]|nr:CPBP family intramembrane metalloprotease [Anaerolineales bacterium]HNN13837.1 CPBP family intramembrane metalloprotease [Anaerolineales bacterium]HNO31627.1 CPBP family intramembrane metalloprotease [Anaerolineales bacterium]